MPLAGTNAAMSSPWPEAGPVAREHWEEDYERLLSAVGDLPIEDLPSIDKRIGANTGAIAAAMLGGKVGYDDIHGATGIDRPSYRLCLSRARRDGLVTADHDLTQRGRWYGIAFKLGVSLPALCVLSDMYVRRCHLWKQEAKSYTKGERVQKKLKMTDNRMRCVYHALVSKEYMYCRFAHEHTNVPGVAYLDDGVFAWLHEYMRDMMVMMVSLK